ncbi:dipeptide ABC transporter ATP-binding protein [Natrinema longum]|uniref:ABC transporter ATP-binding protein n=1 Tax=Natrinema longum TaxID=370324 RepID=A0A8A2UFD8_9EURY|nr:ABC transporter ATP-binding protein [Natrinema longum]MBZ6495629.1 ABC transporter ATP-binding protein [Natrinema longum]QSW86408.1 ABC transporter ATP-binding protein [Natrinema longum]
MSEPLLDVSDLRVRFDTDTGTVRAVDGLSLSVAPGEIVGLVGESGCGKSAAVRAIAGLHGDAARVDGTVTFDGTDLRALPAERRRRIRATRLSTVFQDPSATLTPTRSVRFHLEEALRLADRPEDRSLRGALGLDPRNWGRAGRARRERALELLEQVDLDDPAYLERYPHELSGGEAQRVSIAVALASDPDLLLADEPTTALDATTRTAVLELLAELVAQRDLATLLVSHDLQLVGEYCDRVVVAYAGTAMEAGSADRVLTAPRHPYTRLLLSCKIDGTPPGERLPTIDGTVPDPTAESAGCPFAPRCPHATETCQTTALPTVDIETDGRVHCSERTAIEAATGGPLTGSPSTADAGRDRSRPTEPSAGTAAAAAGDRSQLSNPGSSASSSSTFGNETTEHEGPLLELRDVSKRYPADDSWLSRLRGRERHVRAVDDVSLTVRRGETLGLVGESGAGKSTVIDLITGLESPTAGTIRFDGDPIGTVDNRSQEHLAAVGRLFQHPRSSLDPRQRVRTAIEEPLREADWSRERRRQRIASLLSLVGLDDRHADRRPRQLSGGQCQRVALARAISLEPSVVVLDEPTAALDVSVRAQVCNLLLDLQARLDCAFVLVSHDLGVVRHLADRIAVMCDGRIVESNSAERLCTDPEHAATKRLLSAASGLTYSEPDSSDDSRGLPEV